MAEVTTTKLDADNQILLDQQLLQLPLELQRRNFKRTQIVIDHEQKTTTNLLREAAKSAGSSDNTAEDTLAQLDKIIARMENLKRKLTDLHTDETQLLEQSGKRIKHVGELYEIPNLLDAKYESWSQTRLDRLVTDHLLRSGYSETAAALASEKGITDLTDPNTFIACRRIADSILAHDTSEALVWVKENRDPLKKLLEKQLTAQEKTPVKTAVASTVNPLEYHLRFQEYIELLRQVPHRDAARYEALIYAQKHLQTSPAPYSFDSFVSSDSQPSAPTPHIIAGILAQDPSTPLPPYDTWFSPSRWTQLADLFTETFYSVYSLPSHPLLSVALSAGISALKTPACHSKFNPASASNNASTAHLATVHGIAAPTVTAGTTTNAVASSTAAEANLPVKQHTDTCDPSSSTATNSASQIGTSLCPICSLEFNALATNVPYAHHTNSVIEQGATMLPNGRVYGRERLEELQRKHLRMAGTLTGEELEERVGRPRTNVIDPVTGQEFDWADVKRVFIT